MYSNSKLMEYSSRNRLIHKQLHSVNTPVLLDAAFKVESEELLNIFWHSVQKKNEISIC